MLEAVGTDRVLTVDVHNASAEQNAFRIPVDLLEARNLLVNSCARELTQESDPLENIAILSPDAGGYERAEKFRNTLSTVLGVDVIMVQLDKIRVKREVKASRIIGDVKGKRVIVLDDMIASGGTVRKAEEIVTAEGGKLWGVAATHGLFVGDANENLRKIPRLFVTDTVAPFRLDEENKKKLRKVNTSRMFGFAIGRIHDGTGSISSLLHDDPENLSA
jgi:ribose-phosphate pyrophosphokinase